MNRYREYKDSGIPWIQEIPSEWGLLRFKDKYTNIKEVAGTRSVEYERLALTLNGVIKRPKDDAEGLQPKEFDTYQILEAGDFVFKMIDLQNINTSRVGLSPYTGLVSPAYIRFKPKSDNQCDKYTYYYLMYLYYSCVFNNISGDGVRSALNAGDLGLIRMPYPSLSEQGAIASYLDEQCARIQSLIKEAEKSIEEYKSWRKSILFEAVTKGINPELNMKWCGIDWIGDIPYHWHLVKITRLLDYDHSYPIGDGDHGLIKPSDYKNEGIPYIRVQNLGWGTKITLDNIVYISEETNKKIASSVLRPNDILFAKTGGTIGKTGIIPRDIPVSNTTSHVGKITVDSKYNPRYIFYVLSSQVGYDQFWEVAKKKTTRPELSIDEIKSIRVPLPPTREEQDEIVEYLDGIVTEIDDMICEKQAVIEDLESYKHSLIFEAVTGKRKVV